MENKNESVENNQQEEALKTPQKVSKKRKVIAVAATASVVLAAGVGIGVGVGIYNSSKPKPALIKFVSDADTITKVYNDKGQLVNVSSLQVGDRVCFPSPKTTEISSEDGTEYFAGWATKSSATEPEYYVGEDFITITEKTQSFYPVYMKATSEVLTFEEVAESNSYTVKIDSSTLTDQKIVVIPNQYNGKVISSIAMRTGNSITMQSKPENDVSPNNTIERIIIAKGVKEIKERAFNNLTALKNVTFTTDSYAYMVETETGELASVTIPTSSQTDLTTIGTRAFWGDTALEGISIPASVEEIGNEAFQNCSSLKYVNFTSDSELETIANNTFNGCSSLAKFELPASVKSIGNGTFVNCTDMKEFTVLLDSDGNSQLSTIDGYAFYQSGIESIDLSQCSKLKCIAGKFDEATQSWKKTQYVTVQTFSDCANLKEVKLPSSVEFIGEKVFANCPELTTVEIPEDSALACPIDAWFENCPKLESIFIPKGITSIYYQSFYGCSALTSVEFHPECTLKDQNSSGGTKVFMNSGITSIALPSGWTTIKDYTFEGCTKLENITFTSAITSIGNSAFSKCALLTEFTIPSTVTTIGEKAFYYCSSLTNVKFEQGSALSSVGKYVFSNCEKLEQIGTYDDATEKFDDMIPNGVGIAEGLFQGCSSLVSYRLPTTSTTFTSISKSMFNGCSSLTKLYYVDGSGQEIEGLPSYVSIIGEISFLGAGLTKFIIPSSVTNIGNRALAAMPNLEEIIFECTSLSFASTDVFQSKNLTTITFGENVTSMTFGPRAFQGCPITTINFESTVPPTTLDLTQIASVDSLVSIYVPADSVDAYKSAFAAYADKIVAASSSAE